MSVCISVIIPCHNGERFLAEAIESVLAQTYAAAEILVIDDGSTDGTKAIATRYPQVRYLYQPQSGVSAARNLGIQESQGDYLLFLDHDDRLLPKALELGVHWLTTYPESGFVFGLCRNIDIHGLPSQGSYRAVLERPYTGEVYPNLLRGESIHPPARQIYQRRVVEAIGGFDPNLTVAEDYDFCLRAAARFPGYCHNEVIAEYREHDVSASSTARPSHHLHSTLQVFRKQQPWIQGKPDYEAAYKAGKQHWCHIYGPYIVYDIAFYLKAGRLTSALTALYLLLRYYPQGVLKGVLDYSRKRSSKVA